MKIRAFEKSTTTKFGFGHNQPTPTRASSKPFGSSSYSNSSQSSLTAMALRQLSSSQKSYGTYKGLIEPHGEFDRKSLEEDQLPDPDDGFSGESTTLLVQQPSEEIEQSPYPEVAAVIPNTDDPSSPVLTFRSVVIGIFFTVLLSFINMFFYYRTSPIVVTGIVAQLLAYPLGKLWAAYIPQKKFRTFGYEWSFNPGEFSVKEHVVITTMANASWQSAYIVDVYAIKKIFYGQDTHLGWAMLLVLSSQLLGFGMAGITRRFLVWPAAMIWPVNLVNSALFRALHSQEAGGSLMTPRLRFFLMIFGLSFVWYWFPGFIFPALSAFSVICAFKPDNVVLSQITGTHGLGVGSFMFDWAAITGYLQSPLIVPWWALANMIVGFVFFVWFMTPILYYTDVWDAKTFPINTMQLFLQNGTSLNVTKFLNPDLTLNEAAYSAYGPIRMSTFFALNYGVGFATLTAVLVYTILHEGPKIVQQFKCKGDVHAKLMAVYPEAPEWWYTIVFVASFTLGCIACHFTEAMPWYWMFLAIIIPGIFFVPTGIVQAVSNQAIGLNIITEFVAGLIMPGRPIPVVTFKTYSYMAQFQGLLLVSDLKLGHYMKIPPRVMFLTQVASTIIAGMINMLTAHLLLNREGICVSDAAWMCNNTRTFFSASVIWGLIGPAKMFGPGSIYGPILYSFVAGAILPVPVWFFLRKYPKSWLKYVHVPIILSAVVMTPPAPAGNYPTWFFIGFLFNYIIKKRHFGWWSKYSYVLSAGMDSGVAICGLLIFFSLTFFNYNMPSWWGTPSGSDICPLASANYYGEIN
ncbi:OPT oligopeptide transporter [Planoprotostelium fungivorum]|uniref:OPT oligopeptide transporter n=1 Tax=Planoprotostelium fungivorum TaxID=1890364 RepID=A0A2P6MZ22_9EUKA|nr:OPT oligopeptide transporter [Planoprotostelium fungivorum]